MSPLALSPDCRFDLVLRSDLVRDEAGEPLKSQPPETPTFVFAHLTGRQQLAMGEKLDAFEKSSGSSVGQVREAFEMIRDLLVDWRNIRTPGGEAIPFDCDRLEDVLQAGEAVELAWRVWSYAPDAADLGNSSSPSA